MQKKKISNNRRSKNKQRTRVIYNSWYFYIVPTVCRYKASVLTKRRKKLEFNHKPVLLAECIAGLNINPKGIYVDGTMGGAGHSKKIVEKLSENRQANWN